MRMRPGWGYRRRCYRGTAALLLIAALAVLAASGCAADLPRAGSAVAAAGGEHAPGEAIGAVSPPTAADVHGVRADLDAPCPHVQLAGIVAGNDNAALTWFAPVHVSAGTVPGWAGVRGPPPWTRTVAVAGGRVLLHQLCVIRR